MTQTRGATGRRIMIGFAALLIVVGCQVTPADEATAGKATVEKAPAAKGTPLLATDLLLRDTGKDVDFRWTAAPEMALAPVLLADLRLGAKNRLAELTRQAADGRRDAEKNGYPFGQYFEDARWSAEAETGHLLAFSARIETYTGGAHGMTVFDSALFDRKAGTRLKFDDLLTDPKAFYAAATPVWCRALDAARAVKRAGAEGDFSMFQDCPPLAEQTLVPEGETAITGVRVLVAPYTAGPYVEGTYEVTLPPDTLRKYVKPAYEDAFRIN